MTFLWELLAVLRAMQPVQLTLGPIHIGPLHINNWDPELDDEPCAHHDSIGTVAYQLVAADLRELFEEVAHYRGNGSSDTEAADHGMATLMLRSIESRGDVA